MPMAGRCGSGQRPEFNRRKPAGDQSCLGEALSGPRDAPGSSEVTHHLEGGPQLSREEPPMEQGSRAALGTLGTSAAAVTLLGRPGGCLGCTWPLH